MVDKEKLAKLIRELQKHTNHLKELKKTDFETFTADWKVFELVNRKLHLALQATLDLGESIISEFNFPKPDSYKDIARILTENRVMPVEFKKVLEELAGFRNVLVHEYLYLDEKKVYKHLQKDPEILEKFIEHIKNFVQSEE